MSHSSFRIGIIAGLTAAAIACSRPGDKGANDPTAPCTSGATAQTIPPVDTNLTLGRGFTAFARVVDCHGSEVPDTYTWSSSDTLVLLVSPEGDVQTQGIGRAYAILTGAEEGQVGKIQVFVVGAAAARQTR